MATIRSARAKELAVRLAGAAHSRRLYAGGGPAWARTLEALRMQWTRVPHGLPQLLCALELAFLPPRHVVLAGEPGTADFQALVAVVHAQLGPRRAVLRADAALPWTAPMVAVGGRATAYVCEDYTCQLPVTDPAELKNRLV